MLAVDDQEFLIRRLQFADRAPFAHCLEAELLRRKKQDRSGYGRLGDCRLVEIANLFHLRARKLALEGALVPLDLRDKLCIGVVCFRCLVFDRPFLAVISSDGPYLFAKFFRWIHGEVKNGCLWRYTSDT